jgi:hypothetical protein
MAVAPLDIDRIAAAVASALSQPVVQLTWLQLCDIYEPREVHKLESPAVQRSMLKHLRRLLGRELVSDMSTERAALYRQQRKGDVAARSAAVVRDAGAAARRGRDPRDEARRPRDAGEPAALSRG